MPKAHPLFLEKAAELRALARDPDTVWSYYTHAEVEMIEAGLDENDAVYTYLNGKITKGETQGDLWTRQYRVEAITKDGIHAGFAVRFSVAEKWIETITAFRVKE
jgi:hypothetical protein